MGKSIFLTNYIKLKSSWKVVKINGEFSSECKIVSNQIEEKTSSCDIHSSEMDYQKKKKKWMEDLVLSVS